LVDVTNYVLLETGHPLHAFDFDKLQGRIVVRRAGQGETMVTLDGLARELIPEDLLIADERGPVAIAGVMGGAASEVSASTRQVLLETATFDPRSIRQGIVAARQAWRRQLGPNPGRSLSAPSGRHQGHAGAVQASPRDRH
jgi:phenylalanyl-tRNA synthetase beta subunit